MLSTAVHKSPLVLKQRVGVSRTYIRPVQRHLDLTPLSDNEDEVRWNMGRVFCYDVAFRLLFISGGGYPAIMNYMYMLP